MIVRCPHCESRYRLAETRLGPAGARVRCPRCRDSFTVARTGPGEPYRRPGEPVRPAGEPEPAAPEPKAPEREPANPEVPSESPGRPVETPGPEGPFGRSGGPRASDRGRRRDKTGSSDDEIARAHEALAALDALAGPEVSRAAGAGTLFREFGPPLLEAFDAWQRSLGRRGEASGFRAALRERWGIELVASDTAANRERTAAPAGFARETVRTGARSPAHQATEPLER